MNYNAVGDNYSDVEIYIPPIDTYGSDTFNMPVIYPKSFSFEWIRRKDLTAGGSDTFNMPVIYPKAFTFDITFKGNTPVYGSDTFNMTVIYPKNMQIKMVIKGESEGGIIRGVWDYQIQTTVYKIAKQRSPTV